MIACAHRRMTPKVAGDTSFDSLLTVTRFPDLQTTLQTTLKATLKTTRPTTVFARYSRSTTGR